VRGFLRSLAWVVAHRAWSRHNLVGYARMARARLQNPGLRFEGPVFIAPNVRFEVREGYGRMVIGPYVHFGEGARIRAHEGTLRIGAKSVIGIRNTINTYLDISIGEACLLGDDVYVCDFDHRTEDLTVPIKDQGIVKTPVRIGDDVWIGTKVTVLRGTDLGPGSVVAAGAVVRGSCPPRSVIGGVPARVLRSR
jgi:acetyltransferase-like isoleucine patch superfamily enzyme